MLLIWLQKRPRLYHKRSAQSFDNADTLERDIGGQPVAVGRVVFAADERLQIGAAGRGNAEPVRRDEMARDLLFLVGDRRQRRLADAPAVGLGGFADDD